MEGIENGWGIYFLANDAVYDWLVAAVRSIRAMGCRLPILIIPFDEHLKAVRAFATRNKIDIWDSQVLDELTLLGAPFTRNELGARVFRKFAVYSGPFQKFLFLDADIAALLDLTLVFEAFANSNYQFVYFDIVGMRDPLSVALNDVVTLEFGGVSFNGGAFMASQDLLRLDDLREIAEEIRERGLKLPDQLMEQPFANYAIARRRPAVAASWELIPDFNHYTWAGSKRGTRTDMFKQALALGRDDRGRFPLIHWAGFHAVPGIPNEDIFLHFRLWNASVVERAEFELRWKARAIRRALKAG